MNLNQIDNVTIMKMMVNFKWWTIEYPFTGKHKVFRHEMLSTFLYNFVWISFTKCYYDIVTWGRRKKNINFSFIMNSLRGIQIFVQSVSHWRGHWIYSGHHVVVVVQGKGIFHSTNLFNIYDTFSFPWW